MKQIDDLVIELLEIRSDPESDFTEKEKELIHNIAEMCEKIKMVRDTKEQGILYTDGMRAKDVYEDMLYKIVKAPTAIHMKMAVRMLIPVLDRKIREEEHEKEKAENVQS